MARPPVPRRLGGRRRGRPAPAPGHDLHHAGDAPADQPARRNARAGRGEARADARRGGPAARTRGRSPAPPVPRRRRLDHAPARRARSRALAPAARETVETYYENHWIHRPRQGLDGLSPLAAAQDARRGDSLAQAKLEGVIRVREQLGSRSSALLMYQGYPFDRLRHRLGLPLRTPRIGRSPRPLVRLAPGAQRAQPRGARRRTASRGVQVGRRLPRRRPDHPVRRRAAPPQALRLPPDRPDDGLRAARPPGDAAEQPRGSPPAARPGERPSGSESSRRSFDTWRAEILARTGRPEEAARIYTTSSPPPPRPPRSRSTPPRRSWTTTTTNKPAASSSAPATSPEPPGSPASKTWRTATSRPCPERKNAPRDSRLTVHLGDSSPGRPAGPGRGCCRCADRGRKKTKGRSALNSPVESETSSCPLPR